MQCESCKTLQENISRAVEICARRSSTSSGKKKQKQNTKGQDIRDQADTPPNSQDIKTKGKMNEEIVFSYREMFGGRTYVYNVQTGKERMKKRGI